MRKWADNQNFDEVDEMHSDKLKEIKLKIPGDVFKTITAGEIVYLLLDKALSKSEYYLSKCKEFEEKYRSTFSDFKKKVENNPEEVFSEWDNLMVWEGYELAHLEWKKKYEGLKDCRE